MAARRFGVTQPRLNDLLRGRVSRFSLDALVGLPGCLVALAEHSGPTVRPEINQQAA